MNFIVSLLIKIPVFKRLIPSLYKKYVLFFNQYIKEVQINNVHYNLDLRHLIDRRFFFTMVMKMNYLIPLMIL